MYKKKLEMYERRYEYWKSNTMSEPYRGRFYRELGGNKGEPHNILEEEIRYFWSGMWNSPSYKSKDFTKYLLDFIPEESDTKTFPLYLKFEEIVRNLPNWKSASCDGVYNFFIKKWKAYMSVCLRFKERRV